MSSYKKLRKNINFQGKSRNYEMLMNLIARQKNPLISPLVGANQKTQNKVNNMLKYINTKYEKKLLQGTRTRPVIEYLAKMYKYNLNQTAGLYSNAGKSVKYSQAKKGYTWNHPGMSKKLALLLHEVRGPRQAASKYGKMWMERSGVVKQRANAKNKAERAYAQQNYNKIISNNKTPPSMNKVIKYTKLWLNRNIPKTSTYKNVALIIHPDKGNRTHANNQAKRVALFKLLGQTKNG
jgi:hypothetical protein